MFRIEKDLDEPYPLLIFIKSHDNAQIDSNSIDTQSNNTCNIDNYSLSYKPHILKLLIPIKDFIDESFINRFSETSSLSNVLVFDTLENLNQFYLLLSKILSINQRNILNTINKINISMIDIDIDNIKTINLFLNIIAKIDGVLFRLKSFEFGNMNTTLTLPNFSQLEELFFNDINDKFTFSSFLKLKFLRFKNINAELVLPDLSQLKELQFDDINFNLSFPNFLIFPNFPKLQFLKFRDINAKLKLINFPKLEELSCMNINIPTVLPLLTNLWRFKLHNVNAVLTLSSKTHKVLEFHWLVDKNKSKQNLIIKDSDKSNKKEEDCTIS